MLNPLTETGRRSSQSRFRFLLAAIAGVFTASSMVSSPAQPPRAGYPDSRHPANVYEAYPGDPYESDWADDFDDRFEPDLENRFRNEWVERYWEEEIEDDRADDYFVEAYDRRGNDYTIDYDYDYDYGAYDEPGDDVADYDDVSDNAFDYEGQFAYGNDELDFQDVYDDRYYEGGVEDFVEVPFESDAVADYAESGVLGDKEYERFYENYGAFQSDYDTNVYQQSYRDTYPRPRRGQSVAGRVREDIIDDDYDIVGSELTRDDAYANQLTDAGLKEGFAGASTDYPFDAFFDDTDAGSDWYYTRNWYSDESAFDRWYY